MGRPLSMHAVTDGRLHIEGFRLDDSPTRVIESISGNWEESRDYSPIDFSVYSKNADSNT